MIRIPLASALALILATPAAAQLTTAQAGNSQPAATAPIVDAIPAAEDKAYPGTVRLEVDARDVERGIVRVVQTFAVERAGPLVLLYPRWLPGTHAPEGEIANLAGLKLSAGGKAIGWRRDAMDMHAFHLDVPAGAREVRAEFQYLSAREPEGSERRTMTPQLMNLQWEKMSLYPAGHYVRRIPVDVRLTVPDGWTAYTALRGKATGARTDYVTTDYETLVDSPVFAGRHARSVEIGANVRLNIVGDSAEAIAITPEQIAKHKALVTQADRLFGARHFDHYDFLLAVSDELSGIGLEHHRSSENAVGADLFTDWAGSVTSRDLLPHEYVHSWNGKFRRGADLWTPDYRTPMRDSLLWVYEGLTTFWGPVLAVRSGLWSKDEYLDYLARTAATYAEGRPGQSWRSLADTTNDPIMTYPHGRSEWASWSRDFDYYAGASLVWLEADQLIRQRSNSRRSLDDFARGFFGMRDGDWGTSTYTFADVVAALNAVEPYDWAAFLDQRLNRAAGADLNTGIGMGGYRLAWSDTLAPSVRAQEAAAGNVGLNYAIGTGFDAQGVVGDVRWDSLAFRAGLIPGDKVVAVGERAWSADAMRAAVTAAKGGSEPIRLTVQRDDQVRVVPLRWNGGLRYARMTPAGSGARSIDALLAPR